MRKHPKAYSSAPYDTAVCAWCTNEFVRTKEQHDGQMRYCGRQCAAYGRAVVIPDEHYRRMAKLAHQSRMANRSARLVETLAGLSVEAAYLKGYRSGYSAGKANRRATIPSRLSGGTAARGE